MQTRFRHFYYRRRGRRQTNFRPPPSRRAPPPSRPRRRWPIALALTVCCLLLAMIWLFPSIGNFLIVADPLQPADALVPLGGDQSRVVYSASLFQQGYAPWFVVSDAWIDNSSSPLAYANDMIAIANAHGVPRDRIIIPPGMPRSTYTEALGIRALAQTQGWHALIVVTSPYHTHRTRVILRDVFQDTGITIMVQPVRAHWYQADSWWQSQSGWQATMSEYGKFFLYRIGYRY